MRRVRCSECGKQYNFDVDDFCPRCGAFNQPARSSRIGADGSVIWVEGLNERNHQESFVHEEFHEENKKRRGTPLSKGVRRGAKPSGAAVQSAWQKAEKKGGLSPLKLLKWILILYFGLNILGTLLFSLL